MQASFLFQEKRRQLQVEASIKYFEQHVENTSSDEEFLKVMTVSAIKRKLLGLVNKTSILSEAFNGNQLVHQKSHLGELRMHFKRPRRVLAGRGSNRHQHNREDICPGKWHNRADVVSAIGTSSSFGRMKCDKL